MQLVLYYEILNLKIGCQLVSLEKFLMLCGMLNNIKKIMVL